MTSSSFFCHFRIEFENALYAHRIQNLTKRTCEQAIGIRCGGPWTDSHETVMSWFTFRIYRKCCCCSVIQLNSFVYTLHGNDRVFISHRPWAVKSQRITCRILIHSTVPSTFSSCNDPSHFLIPRNGSAAPAQLQDIYFRKQRVNIRTQKEHWILWWDGKVMVSHLFCCCSILSTPIRHHSRRIWSAKVWWREPACKGGGTRAVHRIGSISF